MFPFFAAVLVAVLSSARCGSLFPKGQYITPNDTTQCGNDLIKWCDNMKFPPDANSVNSVLMTHLDSDGKMSQYTCLSNMDAVNCSKDGYPWFACSKDHEFTYKGKPLTKNEEEGAEGEELCKTACTAFNNLFVQNMSYDNSTTGIFGDIFTRPLERAMKAMREQLSRMNDFFRDFSIPGFGESEPMPPFYPEKNGEQSPKEKNDIERESI